MHLIYSFMAIMLVGLFTIHMSRGINDVQGRMWKNEVLTQASGLGLDILEHIARRPFDEATDESKRDPLEYPVITSINMLTNPADFGGCEDNMHFVLTDCDDIDDFHGITVEREVYGFPFTIEVSVQYVDPANPTTPSGTRTIAKEVALNIQTPLLTRGGQPLEMTMTRVVTYNRHTTAP